METTQRLTERLETNVDGRLVVASSGRQTRNVIPTVDGGGEMIFKYIRFNPAGLYSSIPDGIVPLGLEHLAHHGSDNLDAIVPVGVARMFHSGDQYHGELRFHGETETSRVVEKLWDLGVYRAVSVEVIPDYSNVTESGDEVLFNRADVYGLTVTASPADPGALAINLNVEQRNQAQGLLQRLEMLMSAETTADIEATDVDTTEAVADVVETPVDPLAAIESDLDAVDEAMGESSEESGDVPASAFVSRAEHEAVVQRMTRMEAILQRMAKQNVELQGYVTRQVQSLTEPLETTVFNGASGLGSAGGAMQMRTMATPSAAVVAAVGGFNKPLTNQPAAMTAQERAIQHARQAQGKAA